MTVEHIIENITAQMIRDTAGWSQSEHDLRDTLRLAAAALEAAEAERDELRKALAPFANASRIELVGIDGRRVYCTKADLYTARTLAGDNHE